MKPNFALDLSHDGIALSHLANGSWTEIGRVSLDDPEIVTGLHALRETAAALEPGGMRTELLIPDSQILFTELAVPDDREATGEHSADGVTARQARARQARAAQIGTMLEGRTPYAPEDLAFDWREIGESRVQLAVVARETLGEALAFAREHRFNPVSFAAHARAGVFDQRISFGPAPGRGAATQAAAPDAQGTGKEATVTEPAPVADLAPDATPGTTRDAAPVARDATTDAAALRTAPADERPGDPAPEKATAAPREGPVPVEAGEAAGAASGTVDRAGEARAVSDKATPAAAVPELPPELPPALALDSDPAAPPAFASRRTSPPLSASAQPELAPAADDAPPASLVAADVGAAIPPEAPPDDAPVAPGAATRALTAAAEAGLAADAAEAAEKPEADAAPEAPLAHELPHPRPAALRVVEPASEDARAEQSDEAPAQAIPREAELSAPVSLAFAAPDHGPSHRSGAPVAIPRAPGTGLAGRAQGGGLASRLPPMPPRLKAIAGGRRPPPATGMPTSETVTRIAPAGGPQAPAEPRGAPMFPPTGPALSAGLAGPFGARRKAPPRRSPVLILTLTGSLVAMLGAFAVWSMFWSEAPERPTLDVAALTPGADLAPIPGAAEPFPPIGEGNPESEAPPAPATDDIALTSVAPETGAPAPPAIDTPAVTDDLAPDAEALAQRLAGIETTPESLADDTALARGIDDEALADGQPDAFLEDEPAPDRNEIVLTEPATEPLPEPVPTPEPAEVIATAPTAAFEEPVLPSDPMPIIVPGGERAAELVREQLSSELTPEVAARRYSDSGVWVLPPDAPADPAAGPAAGLKVAAVDPGLPAREAPALPPMTTDGALASPPPPLPAGTHLDLDENGLVRATAEGALNPDGILVYRGRPAVTPPARGGAVPATAAVDLAAGSGEAGQAAGSAPPVLGALADGPAGATADGGAIPEEATPAPALPKVRPRPRPDDLTDAGSIANPDASPLDALPPDTAVTRLHPRTRPDAIVTLASAAKEAAAAEAEALAAEARREAEALASASKFAVAVSLAPRAKPAGIDKIAAAARKAAAPPPPEPEIAVAAKADKTRTVAVLEADDEPALPATAKGPAIPTSASVAAAATVKGAISRSKINLIGVFGTPSTRRALVMLSNGKYQKVKIGDKIDGGQVAAIGDAELIYVKKGRQVRLSMPKKT